MRDGWISVHRQLLDNWLWQAKPFSRGQAWIDMLLKASHADGKIFVRGQIIEVKRGQLGYSEDSLSVAWGWSRNKVRNFLETLEKEGQIVQLKNHISSVVTITNYEQYQNKDLKQNNKRTTEGQQKGTINNVNNVNKQQECPKDFDFFWNEYPKKRKKLDAIKAFLKINPDATLLEKMIASVRAYKQTEDWKKDNGQFVPLPASYLNARRWEDVLKVEVGKAPTSGACMVDKKPATKMRGKKNWWLCDECAEVFKRTAGDHVFYADWSEMTPEQIEKRVLEFKAKRKD